MKTIQLIKGLCFAAIFFGTSAMEVSAQQKLPKCPGTYSLSWHFCRGTVVGKDYQYSGDFENGAYSGDGSFTHSRGYEYNGEFKENKFNGWGTYKHSNGFKFTGWWKDNLYLGRFDQKYSLEPTKDELRMVSSITATAAHSACSLADNPACLSILDTALFAYKNRLNQYFRDAQHRLCQDTIPMEAFRVAFTGFFPYQPGLHSLPASEFLGFVLFEGWSCQRKNQR